MPRISIRRTSTRTRTRRSLVAVIFHTIFIFALSIILELLWGTICNLFKLSLFHVITEFPLEEEEEVIADQTSRRTRNVNPALRIFFSVLLVLLFAFIIVSSIPGIIISTIFAWFILSLTSDMFIEIVSYIPMLIISTVGYIYAVFLVVDTVYRWSGESMTLGQIAHMRTPPWPYTICIAIPSYWYMNEGRLCGVELGWMYFAVDIATTLVIGEIGKWIFEETDGGREVAQAIKLWWSKRGSDGMVGHGSEWEIPGSWQENRTEGDLSRPHSMPAPESNDNSSIIQASENESIHSKSSQTRAPAEFRNHWSRQAEALEEEMRAKRRAVPLRHRPRPREGRDNGSGIGVSAEATGVEILRDIESHATPSGVDQEYLGSDSRSNSGAVTPQSEDSNS